MMLASRTIPMSKNELTKVIHTPLDEIISTSYGKYAKYIIQDRALPDVRDGLKTSSTPNSVCNV